jgi:hypothetical protein
VAHPPSTPKLGEAQAGDGFALGGEKLLHQALLVSLEGIQLPGFRSDQLVDGIQAARDFLLLVFIRGIKDFSLR